MFVTHNKITRWACKHHHPKYFPKNIIIFRIYLKRPPLLRFSKLTSTLNYADSQRTSMTQFLVMGKNTHDAMNLYADQRENIVDCMQSITKPQDTKF